MWTLSSRPLNDREFPLGVLKSYAAYMGGVVSRIKNEETEQKFDEAIQNLLDFEKEHGISNKRK